MTLAGLIEMDDSYFGASKPGKRGRGAAGKAKVVVSVETVEEKPSFAKMQQVHTVSAHQIHEMAQEVLGVESFGKMNILTELLATE